MIKTLRRRFIAIAMGSMAAVLLLLVGGMNLVNYHSMLSSTDIRLDILAENGGSFPTRDTEFSDMTPPGGAGEGSAFPDNANPPESSGFGDEVPPEKPDEKLPRDRRELSAEAPYDTRFFTVVLKDDGTVISIDTGKIAAVSTSEAAEYARSLLSDGKTSGFFHYYRYRAVQTAGTGGEYNTMYIFLDCEKELTSFYNALFSGIGVSILGTFLVFILVVIFSKILVKPVAESYDKQKRFITDASHELKTPLTIIDTSTEVLEIENGENEWTQSIHNQVKRLASLTEKLVFLSRMDEGNANAVTMLDFSLSDAVEETALSFVPVASSLDKKLTLQIAPNLTLRGDEALIRQLVSLLLDNAVKYSVEKDNIILTLKANGRNKILTVQNAVEQISVGNQDILFDRFYRADASRNSSSGGFGIGLSAAKAIVDAHKGSISAKSEDGKSIVFTVILS